MATFILFQDTYDLLTTQGQNEKIINVDEIVHITFFNESPNKRVNSIRARIKLKNGEIFDVKEGKEEIKKLIAF